MGAAYFISDFSSNTVFLAGTPKLNPFAANNLIVKVKSFASNTGAIVAGLNPLNLIRRSGDGTTPAQSPTQAEFAQEINNALEAPLNQVSQGVYAGEKDGYKVTEIKIGEIEYKEYTFNIRGKDVKIRVPKNQQPPSQETMEELY
jgi:hypothetical protein